MTYTCNTNATVSVGEEKRKKQPVNADLDAAHRELVKRNQPSPMHTRCVVAQRRRVVFAGACVIQAAPVVVVCIGKHSGKVQFSLSVGHTAVVASVRAPIGQAPRVVNGGGQWPL